MKFYEKGKDFISERKKRWISLIMVAVMIVTLVPFVPCSEKTTVYAALSAYNRLNRNVAMTGNAAVDIVNIACAQANRTGDDLGYSNDWCAQFVIDCARAAGCSQYIGNSPGVPTFYSQVIRKDGKVVSDSQVQVGDLAFTGNLGHVEIVYKIVGGQIWTVGGNTGNDNLHYAKVTVRDYRRRDLTRFLRPAYGNIAVVEAVSNPDAHSVPTQNLYRGSRGDSVSWVQSICNRLLGSSLDVDGQYGSDTVVTVSSNGLVSIKGTGKAVVTIKASATTKYNSAVKKITIVVKPKKQQITKLVSQKKNKVKVVWKIDSKASGYEVQVSRDAKFTKVVKRYSINTYKYYAKEMTGFVSGRTYYVRVRSYKLVGKDKIYGAYSASKSIKVK